MDDSAVISVHWWVTMTLLCMLALNATEEIKKEGKKKKVKFSFRRAGGIKQRKKVLLPLKFCWYDKIKTTNC